MENVAQRRAKPLLVKSLNLALELDGQGVPLAVDLVAHGHLDPAFADAVLLHVAALFVVKADADVMLKNGLNEMGTTLVG